MIKPFNEMGCKKKKACKAEGVASLTRNWEMMRINDVKLKIFRKIKRIGQIVKIANGLCLGDPF